MSRLPAFVFAAVLLHHLLLDTFTKQAAAQEGPQKHHLSAPLRRVFGRLSAPSSAPAAQAWISEDASTPPGIGPVLFFAGKPTAPPPARAVKCSSAPRKNADLRVALNQKGRGLLFYNPDEIFFIKQTKSA